MNTHSVFRTIALLSCAVVPLRSEPYFSEPLTYSSTQLIDVRANAFSRGDDTVLSCVLSFSSRPSTYTYDLLTSRGEIIFLFPGVTLGGQVSRDSTFQLNYGPLKSVYVQQKRSGSGGGYDVGVTLVCDPAPRYRRDVEITGEGSALTASLLWPGAPGPRAKLWQLKSRRTGLVLALVGVGAASLAAGGYYYWTEYRQP